MSRALPVVQVEEKQLFDSAIHSYIPSNNNKDPDFERMCDDRNSGRLEQQVLGHNNVYQKHIEHLSSYYKSYKRIQESKTGLAFVREKLIEYRSGHDYLAREEAQFREAEPLISRRIQ